MATTVTPEALYFGAPATLTIDGVEMGATLDNPKFGLDMDIYRPRFKNAGGPVKGAARIRGVSPKLTCLVNELSAAKIAHAMPGATETIGTAAETGGGADTTLDGDVAAGTRVIVVASATGIAGESSLDAGDGDFLRIGAPGETEIHRVVSVSGTTVVLADHLAMPHRDGDTVREVDDAGTTIFAWNTNVAVPDSAYVDVEAIGTGVDGRRLRVKVKNALAADNVEFAMGDDDFYGVPLVFIGQYDPSTPTAVPFEVEIG